MNSHFGRWKFACALTMVLALVSSMAWAQGGAVTSTLSGTVVDSSGAATPGADIVVKNNGTGAEFRTVSDAKGEFVAPGLIPGTYTLKVSLMGFKTFSSPDVKLQAGVPATAKVVLELGNLEETVVVTGVTEIVQTTSATVATTLQVKQIESMPLATHTALDYIISLPGLNTSGSNNSRGSTINNLPNRAMNVTMDGLNVQDNRSNAEGFFMYIRPMIESVEEITVSTSNPGAESSGSGAAQIKMVTRSGSNRFTGAVYNTWRNQAGTNDEDTLTRKEHPGWLWGLNTPYWFNKRDQPKTAAGDTFIDDVRLQTPGFRVGGPILKDKLFYFGNWEWFKWPNSATRIRYFVKPDAANGIFRYTDNSGNAQQINLLTLAANNGQVSTVDPTLAKLFADMQSAASTQGGIDNTAELNVSKYSYSPTGSQSRYFPTGRIDYNITPNHRLSGIFRWNHFGGKPDVLNNNEPSFPGFPNQGGQGSERYMWSAAMRSTFGKNVVNEFTIGQTDATGYGTYFSVGVTRDQFNCSGLGCESLAGQGWAFDIANSSSVASVGLTNPYRSYAPSADVAATRNIENNVTWLKGAHTISFGGNWTRYKWRQWYDYMVSGQLRFGMDNRDPAYNLFNTTSGNFPGGINSTQASYARNLYSLITGRLSAFYGGGGYDWNGSEYVFNGPGYGGIIFDSLGFYTSDAWRVKPSLTITGGVRWEIQLPQKDNWGYSYPQDWTMVYGLTGAGSGTYGQGNMFHPGTLTGTNPVFKKYDNSNPAYNTDWNNIGPSIGVAWRPSVKGWASKLLSDAPVIRGGYSLSFTKYTTQNFSNAVASNPGMTRTGDRTLTSGTPQLGADGLGFPVLLSQTDRLVPGTAPSPLAYPLVPAPSETFRAFYPDQNVPMTHQYSLGFQREFGRNTAIDIRYVGNTNVGEFFGWNINDSANWSMMASENGFYDEYRNAQANLRANLVAGKGPTFAYTGAPGTQPLPIFMAYFAGIPVNDARNKDPKNYTSGNFTSSSWYNNLNYYSNSGITGISGFGTSGLQNNSFAANATAAGLPANFFRANPYFTSGGSPNIYVMGGNRRFNALQFEVRRRLSGGLVLGGSYQRMFGLKGNTWRSLREDPIMVDSTSAPIHAIKANWSYQLPFGQGKAVGGSVSNFTNYLIGNWEFSGVLRTQSGDRFNYGNYRLVGMSEQEFHDMFKFYFRKDSKGLDRIYMFPQDVITQSIIAIYGTDPADPTGYAKGVMPTGRYIAPASGPDCVQYLAGMCPGTKLTRIVDGPWFFKTDFSFVKRFPIKGRSSIEARMDLFNVFNNINFVSTTRMGNTPSAWEVISAATDLSAAQDPGGRITQFGLRFTW